jgi:SdrD B-like domain/HYR domain
MTGNYTVASGDSIPTVDQGYYIPASIGNYVWNDVNANGVQDAGETGIPGVTVTLTGTDGLGNPVTQTTVTDGLGNYLFDELVPGTYKLTFGTPAGFDFTSPVDQGGNDALDSDANPAMGGMTVNEVLTSGEYNPNYDAGFYMCPEIEIIGLPLQPVCPDATVDAILIKTVPMATSVSWTGGQSIGMPAGSGPGWSEIPPFVATAEGMPPITVTAILGQCTITETFMIKVDDSTPPFFEDCPATPLVFGTDPDQCSALVNWSNPVAEDNCELNVVVTQTAGPAPGTVIAATCPPAPITITYVANDGNGNTASCNFTILVRDTEKPEFDADIQMPADTLVDCDKIPTNCVFRPFDICTPLTLNDVTDNCTPRAQLVLNFNQVSTQNPNPAVCAHYNYTITRTWSVTDCAGNTLSHVQVITVQDTIDPVVRTRNLTLTLDKNGKVTLNGRDLDDGTTDRCAPNSVLVFTASEDGNPFADPITFDCGDLGPNVVTLRATDPCGNSATATAIVTIQEGIAPCEPQFTTMTTCLNNATMNSDGTSTNDGQFEDMITIKSLAMQTWAVTSSTGAFTNTSANPPAAPTAIANGTLFTAGTADGIDNDSDGTIDEADEMIFYTLKVRHTECVGYTMNVSNAGGIGMDVPATPTTAVLANKACYPTPIFTNLSGPYCLNTPPFEILVGEANGATGTVTMTINGVNVSPGHIFNAAALGLGSHTVVATFDAGGATNTFTVNGVTQSGSGTMAQALANPGCQQMIKLTVQVVTTPAAVACNDLVHLSIDDEDCKVTVTPDMVLEGTYFCFDDYSVVITYPAGVQSFNPPNMVNQTHVGLTLNYTLVHPISGNMCWGQILVEDKLPPALVAPADITVPCSASTAVAVTGNIQIDDCTATTTVVSEQFIDLGQCSNPRGRLIRTWIVTDAWGNQSTASQTITITPFSFDDLQWPPDRTINCEATYNNPNATDPSNTGRPSLLGFPIGAGGLCMASINVSDERYDVCAGTYEILRTWKVRNMCLPVGPNNPREHVQVIKVVDNAGPQFACPPAVTVSTNSAGCCATSPLPSMIVSEGCSDITSLQARVDGFDPITGNIITFTVGGSLSNFPGNNLWTPDTLAVFGTTQCLPIGNFTVTYTAGDNCSNTSSCQFTLTVEDLVPPHPICHEWTQVGIGSDGQILVNAVDFNNGSTDNCNPLSFKARRMDANTCQSNELFLDQVRFCCSDVNDTIQVILRVYDRVLGAGSLAQDSLQGHYNDCMVNVLVEDKLRPLCAAPANMTVNCENFDPTLWSYGNAEFQDNCCLGPEIAPTADYSRFDTVCNRGTITRTFRRSDCNGNGPTTCTQRIIVDYRQDYFVRFPNDVLVTTCNAAGNYGQPVFFGEDCELLSVSYTDEIFTVVTDACFQIERSWSVINWCTYNPNQPLISVPNPNPNATFNSTQNLQGPTVSEAGTQAPWAPSSIALLPGQAPFNYATLWNANANGYTYKQLIRVIDTQDPIIVGCQDSVHCDVSDNDANLWNATPWWDAVHESHDLCEGELPANIVVSDACSNAGLQVSYLLYLDLDGDGIQETVVNSINPPAPGEVNVGNANNPNFTGGTPTVFDQRNVPLSQKYRFAIERLTTANGVSVSLKFNTIQSPNTFAPTQLPYGNHKIKWTVSDGCGNESTCIENLSVRDCKAPIVVCINGLTSNIGPTGVCPTLWVTDFLLYAYDNCTPEPQLRYGIRKSGTGTGFPYAQGSTSMGNQEVSYGCQDLPQGLSSELEFVEVWAIDRAGNASFCETYVKIQDNSNVCNSGSGATVAGVIKTEEVEGVEEAIVELASSMGNISNDVLSDVQGAYLFSDALPIGSDYTVTPELVQDPKNGVTTYDLLLISRHILGLEPLNSPYKMIAADANKSNTITSFDIVELRKLVLGVYNELPNNESWRFVDKTQVFTVPQNPFVDVIREDITVAQIAANSFDDDFVGIKVGDVNLSAQANGLMAADDRSNGTLVFNVDAASQKVKAGEEVIVNFSAANTQIGYQFTLNLAGLEVVEIVPGAGMSEENFAVFAGAITTSAHATQGAFSVKFRATQAGDLSEMMNVSSRITRAVGYNDLGENLDIALRFAGKQPTGVGFEVYQNVPNPWITKTNIGFHLPAADRAVLTVYDQTGRVVLTQEGDFAKGYNAFTLNVALLNEVGSMYYTITTSTDTGTKQMIQVK